MPFTRHMHIDIETFSKVNLLNRGMYVYAEHESTEILMACVAYGHDAPVHLDFTVSPPPVWLLDDLVDPTVEKLAFNAPFEFEVILQVWDLDLQQDQWTDVMVQARSLSFNGTLQQVGECVGIALDKRKLAHGKTLIRKFCIPTAGGGRNTRESHPDEWADFCIYNVQDVEAERAIHTRILPYLHLTHPTSERELWLLDQKINQTGLPIDMELVESAFDVYQRNNQRLLRLIKKATNVENPNSPIQIVQWAESQGVKMAGLTKEIVRDTLLRPDLPSGVRAVLELRQEAGKTSPKKFSAFADRTSADDHMRGGFSFYGAARTGRWAGGGVQPHNLVGSTLGGDDLHVMQRRLSQAIAAIKARDTELLELMFPSITDALVSTIRCAIAAPAGKTLRVADLSSIETVVIGWLSGCRRILELFRNGKDAYKDFAVEAFGTPYEQVTKAQRKFSKPPVLGCGFALGGDGLVAYAQGYGVDLSELFQEDDKWLLPDLENPGEVDGDWLSDGDRAKAVGKRLVNVYRSAYHEVPAWWKVLKEASFEAVAARTTVDTGTVIYEYRKPFLFCHLPSGRSLAYFNPEIRVKEHPKFGQMRALTYEGVDQYTRQWARLSTHPGKLAENIVQAVARDLLAEGLRNADAAGFEVVGHVHDEIIAMTPTQGGLDVNALIKCMSTLPSWAKGMPVGATGWEGKFYLKD